METLFAKCYLVLKEKLTSSNPLEAGNEVALEAAIEGPLSEVDMDIEDISTDQESEL